MALHDMIAKLREDREELFALSTRILESATSETRDLTVEEAAEIEEFNSQIDAKDARIIEYEKMVEKRAQDIERRAKFEKIIAPETKVRVSSEPLTYDPMGKDSFFRDLVNMRVNGDDQAKARLDRHMAEVRQEMPGLIDSGRVGQEWRDLTRTDTAGGNYVPPLHMVESWAQLARAGRPVANLTNQRPLPPGTDSINIPRNTTGPATAVQTADNAAVQETDLVEALETAPVKTITGQQDVAIQLLDQSPIAFDEVIFSELLADYAQKLDDQVLNGSGSSGQVTGMKTVSGINAVTYTDATPTVGELYAKLADAVQQIYTNRFLPPTHVIMHPRRWGWFLAALDTQNRPLVVPFAGNPMNAVGVTAGAGVAAEGPVGSIMGLPVVLDANIKTNLGGGTEDLILVARMTDQWLWESSIRTRVLPDVGSGNLTVRLQVYGYLAFSAGRYPKAISTIGGTGLIAPTF